MCVIRLLPLPLTLISRKGWGKIHLKKQVLHNVTPKHFFQFLSIKKIISFIIIWCLKTEEEGGKIMCKYSVDFSPVSPLYHQNIICKKALAHYFPTSIIPMNYVFLKAYIEHRPGWQSLQSKGTMKYFFFYSKSCHVSILEKPFNK